MSAVEQALDNVRQSLVERFEEERLGTKATGVWPISVTGYANRLNTNQVATANTNVTAGLLLNTNTSGSTGYPGSAGSGITLSARRAPPTNFSSVGTFDIYSENSGLLEYWIRKVTAFTSGAEVWAPWSKLLHTGMSLSNDAGFMALNSAPDNLGAWLSTPSYGVNQGDGRTHFGYKNSMGDFVNYIRGVTTEVPGLLVAAGGLQIQPNNNPNNNTTWSIGPATWPGSNVNHNGSAGVMASGALGQSHLFTFSSAQGQCSIQTDGSLFLGEGAFFNPFSNSAGSSGCLLVSGTAAIAGDTAMDGNLHFNNADVLGEIGRIGFRIGGIGAGSNEMAFIRANRHTSDGRLTDLEMGALNGSGTTLSGVKYRSDGVVETVGTSLIQNLIEKFATGVAGISGGVNYDYAIGSNWYNATPAGNWTMQLLNIPAVAGQAVNITNIVNQGATGYIPNAMTINGAAVTIRWAGGLAPIPSQNAIDVFTFNLLYVGGAWIVLGTATPYSA